MLRIEKRATIVRWSAQVEFRKYDAAQGLSFGYASLIVDKSGGAIVDHDEDIIEPAELEGAAYRWVESSRVIGEQHARRGVANLVEAAYLNVEKRAAMGGFDPADKSEGFWIGVRWTDPATKEKAAKGLIKEWSIAGWAKRVLTGDGNVGKLIDLELDEISGVDRGAGIGVQMSVTKGDKVIEKFFVQSIHAALAKAPADKRAPLEKKLEGFEKLATIEEIKAKLTAEEWDVLMTYLQPAPPEVDENGDPVDPPVVPVAAGATSKNRDDDAREEIAKMRSELAFEKALREVAESPVLKYYPANKERVAKLWAGADKETRDEMLRVAKALKESELLKSKGTARSSDDAGDSADNATAEVLKLAQERVSKSDGKLSFPAALKKIEKERPELYTAYVKERRAGGARN